jgi:hypothetical protein
MEPEPRWRYQQLEQMRVLVPVAVETQVQPEVVRRQAYQDCPESLFAVQQRLSMRQDSRHQGHADSGV